MKTLCIVLLIAASLFACRAHAQGELKHGLVSAAIAGGVTEFCERNFKSNGQSDAWGCWGFGVMTSFLAGAAFEIGQEDYSNDLRNDLTSNAIGAIVGASIAIKF